MKNSFLLTVIAGLPLSVPLANQIKNWAEIMPTKFPTGSDGPPSEAAPAIWTDFEGFKLAARENFEAASFLEVTALNGDAKATAKAIKQLAGTCKSCHQSYRTN